ncbi:TRAP-type C4-dicarboxylate transport system, small permease component [plant metagenome]|uniref:TRAP-type C4-dicarboxylate transport system, small permease component n=1 Tax=plant metagenome TaxID=1297885 RepID=A0A484SJ48_9ZZZZ
MDSMLEAGATAADTSTRQTVSAKLSRYLELSLGLVFCGVVVLNFASAALRYLGGRAILGADEIQVYAMVWLVFVGAAIAAARRMHLCMDVFTARLSGRVAWWRDMLESLLAVVVCATMSWVSLRFVMQIQAMGQLSDGAGIPMWIAHTAVLIGFGAMALISLVSLVSGLLQARTARPN